MLKDSELSNLATPMILSMSINFRQFDSPAQKEAYYCLVPRCTRLKVEIILDAVGARNCSAHFLLITFFKLDKKSRKLAMELNRSQLKNRSIFASQIHYR